MRVVEIGDCSIVIMKDSSDAAKFTVGSIYRAAVKSGRALSVMRTEYPMIEQTASEFIYTAGRLILFFKEKVNSNFKNQDKVALYFD